MKVKLRLRCQERAALLMGAEGLWEEWGAARGMTVGVVGGLLGVQVAVE